MAQYVIHCFLASHNFICVTRFLAKEGYSASDGSKLILINSKRIFNIHTEYNRHSTIFLKLDPIQINLHRKIVAT